MSVVIYGTMRRRWRGGYEAVLLTPLGNVIVRHTAFEGTPWVARKTEGGVRVLDPEKRLSKNLTQAANELAAMIDVGFGTRRDFTLLMVSEVKGEL